jgi:hypothetical protein
MGDESKKPPGIIDPWREELGRDTLFFWLQPTQQHDCSGSSLLERNAPLNKSCAFLLGLGENPAAELGRTDEEAERVRDLELGPKPSLGEGETQEAPRNLATLFDRL